MPGGYFHLISCLQGVTLHQPVHQQPPVGVCTYGFTTKINSQDVKLLYTMRKTGIARQQILPGVVILLGLLILLSMVCEDYRDWPFLLCGPEKSIDRSVDAVLARAPLVGK